MANTVVSTNTTAAVFLGANEHLTVLGSGSIVNYNAVVDGSVNIGQTVSIAGYVEMSYMWLAGQNIVSIGSSGTFISHGLAQGIYIGVSFSNVITGNCTVNNAGLISADVEAVTMFGSLNRLNNTGSIYSTGLTVDLLSGNGSSIFNSGTISSSSDNAVSLEGSGSTRMSGAGSTSRMSGLRSSRWAIMSEPAEP